MNAKPLVIQTERLCLSAISDKDVEDMVAILTSDEVKRTFMLPDFHNREEAVRLHEKIRDMSHDASRFVYGVYLNDRLVGFINEVEVNGAEIELGYVVHPSEKNRGYATEAVAAAIHALFACGYAVVKAGAFEGNVASMRVMEKCGMHRTEYTEDIEYRDQMHRCIFYEIKASADTDA